MKVLYVTNFLEIYANSIDAMGSHVFKNQIRLFNSSKDAFDYLNKLIVQEEKRGLSSHSPFDGKLDLPNNKPEKLAFDSNFFKKHDIYSHFIYHGNDVYSHFVYYEDGRTAIEGSITKYVLN